MRKRTLIAAAACAALVLVVAPGSASAEVFVPWGGQFGNITEATPPATTFTSGVYAPWGGQFGNITEVTTTIMPAGVMVPTGSALGNITIATPPNVVNPGGVLVPKGSGLGNITIEKPLSTSHVPGPVPALSKPATNSCYQGACPDQVLGGIGPAAGEAFGGGMHSTGPQQAIRDGIFLSVTVVF